MPSRNKNRSSRWFYFPKYVESGRFTSCFAEDASEMYQVLQRTRAELLYRLMNLSFGGVLDAVVIMVLIS